MLGRIMTGTGVATIVDVARLAGVSISTVSHVVNGTRNVSDGTRERVLSAIAATNYRQHSVARALRRSQTDTLGLILSDAGEVTLDEIVLGVEHEARRHGMTVLLAHAGDDPELELAAVQTLTDQRVDGLLIIPVAHSRAAESEALAAGGVPYVVIDRPTTLSVDQVGTKNTEPMQTLVQHLVSLGHTRIGYVGRGALVSTLIERRDGFLTGLSTAGLEPLALIENVTSSAIRAALTRALSPASRPTALVAANQMSAVHVLEICNDLGLRIPDDLSLAMFDTFPFADLFHPQITAVVQPTKAIGREAVKLLRRRIENPSASPRSIWLPPKVVYRRSSGPVGTGGAEVADVLTPQALRKA